MRVILSLPLLFVLLLQGPFGVQTNAETQPPPPPPRGEWPWQL